MLTSVLLYAGLIPLAVSAIASLLLRRAGAPPRTIWPVALAGGFLAGQLAIKSEAGVAAALYRFIQPQEAIDWLPLIVLLALGVSAVMWYSASIGRLRVVALAAAFALAVPVRLLSGNVRLTHQWSVLEKLVSLVLLAGTLGIVWLLLATESEDEPAILRVPLLILVAVCSAAVVTQSGAFVNGLSCGAVAAAIVGTAIACTLLPTETTLGATGFASAEKRAFHGVSGAAGVLTFSLGSLILLGYFYAYLSVSSAASLFIALAATGAPLPNSLQRRPVWQQLTARMALCVLPLAIAVISAFS